MYQQEPLPRVLEETTTPLDYEVYTEVPQYLEVEVSRNETDHVATMYLWYN